MDMQHQSPRAVTEVDNLAGLETVAVFERYEELQAFLDRLSDDGFPVDGLIVLGRDLKFVERITGRLNAFKAALYGGLSGLWIGLLFGFLFAIIFAPTGVTVLTIALYWLAVGFTVGAILGLVTYAVVGRYRSFTSDLGIRPAAYELLADPTSAEEVRRRLKSFQSLG